MGKERKYARLRESDKVVGDNISNYVPSYTKDKYTGVWLRHELPYSQVFTNESDLKKIAHDKAFVDRDENDGHQGIKAHFLQIQTLNLVKEETQMQLRQEV